MCHHHFPVVPEYKLIGSEVVLGTEAASEPFSVQVLSRKPHTTSFISPVCLSSLLSALKQVTSD